LFTLSAMELSSSLFLRIEKKHITSAGTPYGSVSNANQQYRACK
jgi:hypothetical protein